MTQAHYIFITIIIIGIIAIQWHFFKNTSALLKNFRNIFPQNANDAFRVYKNDEGASCICEPSALKLIEDKDVEIEKAQEKIRNFGELNIVTQIDYGNLQSQLQARREARATLCKNLGKQTYENECLNAIVSSINNYLRKNRNSTADFHLMKDIVDRNCDGAEDEINTQIPIPLYCGLAGTMLGIIVGVGALWLSGDLHGLLTSQGNGAQGVEGIETLIGGVALAMIASLVGIGLTTRCSIEMKKVKKECEQNKHNFLSWIQAELLPSLTTDATSAINRLVDNLLDFNKTFSQNTKELKESLSIVNQSTGMQVDLLNAINELKISRIAKANVEVYEALKGCTDEIGMIGDQLKYSEQYLKKVSELTDKLDASDQRIQAIEEMGNYFKKERSNIDMVTGIINHTIDKTDAALGEANEKLKENITEEYAALIKHLNTQREGFEQCVIELQDGLGSKLNELSTLTTEIKNLKAVKTSLDALVKSTDAHNRKLDTLADAIKELALIKANGNAPVGLPLISKKLKIMAIVGGSIVLLYCLAEFSALVYYYFIR